MKNVIVSFVSIVALSTTLLTACTKEEMPKQPLEQPQPELNPNPPVEEGFFTIRLKAAITVGDVIYDSIPATFRITSWDNNGVQHQKDTTLEAGAQIIKLPRAHSRFAFYVNKWGVEDQLVISKNEVTDFATYTLKGSKAAKKLQAVTQYSFVNGAYVVSSKKIFSYDAQGRIKAIDNLAPGTEPGSLRLAGQEVFTYNGNQLGVDYINKGGGNEYVVEQSAYAFDALGRTIRSEYKYLTQHEIYNNHFTENGINMLMGENASDPNGARIALKFTGGNRVEEKTVIPDHETTVKFFRYDFNINPYAVIKMPSVYFELASKNNVVAEGWSGTDHVLSQYSYDAEGYVTQVIKKERNNNGQVVPALKTVFTY